MHWGERRRNVWETVSRAYRLHPEKCKPVKNLCNDDHNGKLMNGRGQMRKTVS